MSLTALVLATALAAAAERPADAEPAPKPPPAPDPVRVECEGAVRYRVGADGRTHLVLTGGVILRRGETVLRARAADAVLARDGQSLETVRAEGEVTLRSPAFSARADVAGMRAVPPAPGVRKGAPPAYEMKLERRERAEVELRAGDVLVACRGPLTYATRSREARLTGGVRAESPKLRARCEEATVILRERRPPPPLPKKETKGEVAEGKAGENTAKATVKKKPALPAVESMELRGGVVLDVPGKKGAAPRRVRAARALYRAAEDTVAFTGEPAPVVEYGGVTLTAPEIVLHLKDNRIVPRGGKMRALIGPAK